VDVKVQNPDFQSITQAGGFTYVRPPIVSGILPSEGPTTGGVTITINGADFTGTPTVTFGSNAAAVTFASTSQLRVTIPSAGSAGAVTVTVRNPSPYTLAGTGSFTYDAPGSSIYAPAASCLAIKSGGYGSTDGTYYIAPDGVLANAFAVYCDMTSDGGGWTLAVRMSNADWAQYQTGALNKSDLTLVSDPTTRTAKLSDAEYNAINPDQTWVTCYGRQTIYRRNKSTAWYSNHGAAASCSYDRSFWTGMKKTFTDGWNTSFTYQACGGGLWTGQGWGALQGIQVNDSNYHGCYAGCSVGTTCSASKYSTGGSADWNSNGLVFIR